MNDKIKPEKKQPATIHEVHELLGQHRQKRQLSCFLSAPEIWLKLNKVIDWADYPEQSFPENDPRGYEPYPNDGFKIYNGTAVHFQKETFNAPYATLFEKLSAELAAGRYAVLSLRPPWSSAHWHGYLVTHMVGDDFVVFTKHGLNDADTQEDRLKSRLVTNEKVDCLFMKIVKQP